MSEFVTLGDMFRTYEFRRALMKVFAVGTIAFFIGILITAIPFADQDAIYKEVHEVRESNDVIISTATGGAIPEEYSPFTLPSVAKVLINNVIIAVLAILSAVYINKYFPYMAAIVQGIPMGIMIATYLKYFSGIYIFVSLFPHGIIEIPAIICAGACGAFIANNKEELQNTRELIMASIIVVVAALVFASFVEVFITPNVQRMIALTFGVM
jgi:uncharacterized membrane protein SpoIIM required for sporulation